MAFKFGSKKQKQSDVPSNTEQTERVRPANVATTSGPISGDEIERMRNQLLQTHTDVVVRAMTNATAKDPLRKLIQETFAVETKGGNDQLVEYILDEVVSSGVVIMPFGGQGHGNTYNQPAPVVDVEQESGLEGIRGLDPSKLVEVTDGTAHRPFGSKQERVDDLRDKHEELIRKRADREQAELDARKGSRQPARTMDVDDLGIIRQNQERVKELGDKILPIADKMPKLGKSSKKAKQGSPIDLELVDEELAKKARKENGVGNKKRKGGKGTIDSDSIQALRKGIKADQAPTYDPSEMIDDEIEGDQDPADFISDSELASIRDALVQGFPGLVIRGMMDDDARKELEKEVVATYGRQTRGGQDFLVQYIVRETVGTGVIESILENDPSITDMGYDGQKLIIESNDKKYIYQSNQDINDDYIIRLVNKFAFANGRDFTPKDPIFDGKFNNIRINAMYDTNTTAGVTMALRVVRPKLALREETFDGFAPHYIYQFLESMVMAKGNFMLAGETGTGKTELQKLLASFIPFNQRIVLIEDVAETFLKEMFPEKDIFSWLTSTDVTITKLVKASLRNNPRWIIVSETRGAEAYEMIQAVLSGHSIITTLHAINARAIPKRLVNMAKMGYEFSEEALEGDIRRYFDFGVHIIRTEHKGKTIRYLSELLYFDEDGDQTVFKQDFVDGQFVVQCGEIPDLVKRRVRQAGQSFDEFKENYAHIRDVTVDKVTDDNGKESLDLKITDGRALGFEEVEVMVTEVIVDKEKMTAYPHASIQTATASSIRDARQHNAPIVAVDQSPRNVAGVKPTPVAPMVPKFDRGPVGTAPTHGRPAPHGQNGQPRPSSLQQPKPVGQQPNRPATNAEQANKGRQGVNPSVPQQRPTGQPSAPKAGNRIPSADKPLTPVQPPTGQQAKPTTQSPENRPQQGTPGGQQQAKPANQAPVNRSQQGNPTGGQQQAKPANQAPVNRPQQGNPAGQQQQSRPASQAPVNRPQQGNPAGQQQQSRPASQAPVNRPQQGNPTGGQQQARPATQAPVNRPQQGNPTGGQQAPTARPSQKPKDEEIRAEWPPKPVKDAKVNRPGKPKNNQ